MRSAVVKLVLILATALPLACGDLSSGDALADPRSGTWSFAGSPPVDDSCGLEDLYVDPPGTFTLTNNGDQTFTIDDGENVFDCELEGANFSCPERLTGSEPISPELMLDAVVEYTVGVSGTLSSDTQMSGRQQVEIVCVGADCAAVEMLVGVTTPCGWAQDFSAEAL